MECCNIRRTWAIRWWAGGMGSRIRNASQWPGLGLVAWGTYGAAAGVRTPLSVVLSLQCPSQWRESLPARITGGWYFKSSAVNALSGNVGLWIVFHYYYYYYCLLKLSFHSVAVVLALVQTKQIIYINETIQKHNTNNTKHSKYKYKYYPNTHT